MLSRTQAAVSQVIRPQSGPLMVTHYTRAANRRKLAKAGSNFLSLPAPSLDKIENNEGISTPYESVGAQERTRTSTAFTTGT